MRRLRGDARPGAGLVEVRRPDGVRLAVEVSGPHDATATVVLAHGWTLSRSSWRPVVERVRHARPDVRVLTYDQRGHGDSTAVGRRAEASMAVLADDLAAVVEEVAPQGRLVLGGHSMGGMCVLALAGRHPDLIRSRVDGVVLVNTAAAALADRRLLGALMRLLAAAPGWLRVPRVPARLARRLGYGREASPDLVAKVRRGVRPPRARSVGTWYQALMRLDESESLRHLDDVPVRIVAGDTDRLTPHRHAETIASSLPRAELEVVPGTGHMLLFEHPDRVTAQLLGVLPAA